MKNLLLILGLIATTALNAQDAVQFKIEVANFNYHDYTFADVFFIDREGNVNQAFNKTQLLPGCGFEGNGSKSLQVGSMLVVDMYNRAGDFTHSFSAYVIEDGLGGVKTQIVEPSDIISLKVGNQETYIEFLLSEY